MISAKSSFAKFGLGETLSECTHVRVTLSRANEVCSFRKPVGAFIKGVKFRIFP